MKRNIQALVHNFGVHQLQTSSESVGGRKVRMQAPNTEIVVALTDMSRFLKGFPVDAQFIRVVDQAVPGKGVVRQRDVRYASVTQK